MFPYICRITYSKALAWHDFKVYNLGKFLKIVQSCTGFLGVAGPSTRVHKQAPNKMAAGAVSMVFHFGAWFCLLFNDTV